MKKFAICITSLLLAVALSGCMSTPQATTQPSPTTTPDLCGPAAIAGEVDRAHKLMREFDDASLLGTNTPRDQLPPVISDMQRIRREAEDQIVPGCLAVLKQLQLAHMDTVINTLVSFLGGADQSALNQGAELARQQHNAYAIEYARLLGLTVVVPSTATPDLSSTATPLAATAITVIALNPGPQDINMYSDPSVDSTIVAVFFVNETARVMTQTPDRQWIQIQIPGQVDQLAWVQASLVTLSQPE
jgi:hypothetical protein